MAPNLPPSRGTVTLLSLVALLAACGASPSGEAQGDPGTASTPAAPSDSPLVDLVTSPALAPYFHADVAGRVPVRIVADPNSTDRPDFRLLGQPVQWIPAADATPGSAYLVVEFQLVDGLLNLSVRYPIESVRASAVYAPDGDSWVRMAPVRVVEE